MAAEVVEQWNAQWEYPKLILGRPEDFFRYIEKNFAAKIPVLKADFGGWWEDGAGSARPKPALCRRAEERAVTAEMLHSLAAVLARSQVSKSRFSTSCGATFCSMTNIPGARRAAFPTPKAEQTVKQWEVKALLRAQRRRGFARPAGDWHGRAGGLDPGGGPGRV